jgi:hypothetical protein
MKEKLFAVAMVVLLYSFFVVAFTMADNHGLISNVLNDVGISSSSAMATPSINQGESSGLDASLKSNLIDPMPDPIRPRPKPRP